MLVRLLSLLVLLVLASCGGGGSTSGGTIIDDLQDIGDIITGDFIDFDDVDFLGCDTNPDQLGCPGFCAANPKDTFCNQTEICNKDPDDPLCFSS